MQEKMVEAIAFSSIVYTKKIQILPIQATLVRYLQSFYDVGEQEFSEQEAAALDKSIEEMLREDQFLTPLEKNFLYSYYNLVIWLASSVATLAMASRQAGRLDFKKAFQQREESLQQGAEHLANFLEMWRERLVTDVDKVIAWGEGETFFQKSVLFLYKDLNRPAVAFSTVETARGRAFLDLLSSHSGSTPEEMQIGNTFFSPAYSTPVSYENIRKLLETDEK